MKILLFIRMVEFIALNESINNFSLFPNPYGDIYDIFNWQFFSNNY